MDLQTGGRYRFRPALTEAVTSDLSVRPGMVSRCAGIGGCLTCLYVGNRTDPAALLLRYGGPAKEAGVFPTNLYPINL
jgi:hypothetical protein